MRRPYPPEVREEVVRLYLESDLTGQEVADKFGISLRTLHHWVCLHRRRVLDLTGCV